MNKEIQFFEVGKCYRDKEEGTFIYMRVDTQDGDFIFGSVVEVWNNTVTLKEDYPLNHYMDKEDAEEVTNEAFNKAVDVAVCAIKDIAKKIKKI